MCQAKDHFLWKIRKNLTIWNQWMSFRLRPVLAPNSKMKMTHSDWLIFFGISLSNPGLWCWFQWIPEIWFSVSTSNNLVPLAQFQIIIFRQADPPPEAKTCGFQGHHESAFTPAWWSVSWRSGVAPEAPTSLVQMFTILSLPPEAKNFPSGDHSSPETSSSWLSKVETRGFGWRTSKFFTWPERDPDDISQGL